VRSGGGVTDDGFDMHRPVWVKLSAIFLRGGTSPCRLSCHTPQLWTRLWKPRGSCCSGCGRNGGEWLGLVTYPLPFADGRKQTIDLERQLVPAYALRPRKYGSYRRSRRGAGLALAASGLDLVSELGLDQAGGR
jgi:hypothetical protein